MLRRWMCYGQRILPVLFFCLFCVQSHAAGQPKKYALLIGNSDYSIGQLDNPVNDARDLANVLKQVGFETIIRTNANADGMKAAIREFGEKIRGNDGIGFFFFAGHGVQVNGENYLLPIGYNFRNEKEVEEHAVQANTVMRYMEEAKNRVNIVVLDACRNNPFVKTRSLKTRGLAPMDAPSGSLVAFSTAPGTEASDGTGKNGLYTKHLMANIRSPGLTIEQVFKRTRDGVEKESERDLGRKQSPREESSLKGDDLYFVPPAASAQDKASEESIELSYWNSIQGSTNPADFDAYLNRYPKGRFADLARNRLTAAKSTSQVAKAEARSAFSDDAPPTRVATAKPSKVYSSNSNFSFDDDDSGGKVRMGEFLSISCRDVLRGKRIALGVNRSNPLYNAIDARLRDLGIKTAAQGDKKIDFVLRGSVDAQGGVNPVLGINEVDVETSFTLSKPAGKTVATASVSSGAYAGRNSKAAVKNLVEEQTDEVLGKLFKDYCSTIQ